MAEAEYAGLKIDVIPDTAKLIRVAELMSGLFHVIGVECAYVANELRDI